MASADAPTFAIWETGRASGNRERLTAVGNARRRGGTCKRDFDRGLASRRTDKRPDCEIVRYVKFM
jgi:hypothetical protein